jgi:hypothetical protein
MGIEKESWKKPPAEPQAPVEPTGPAPVIGSKINRCPFCHEGLRAESRDWVACGKCLARHHRGCWSEGGKCSACGSSERVEPPTRVRLFAALGVVVVLIGALAGRALVGGRSRGPGVCSWASVAPGTSFKIVTTQRRIKAAAFMPISTTEGWQRQTLVSKSATSATVRKQICYVAPKVMEMESVDKLDDDLRSAFLVLKSQTKETIEVPAGRFACDHFSGRGNDIQGRESQLDIWVAPGLPLPVKNILKTDEVENTFDLVEIGKP